MTKNILITGGAGFIGSNLVAALLTDSRVGKVRVLDNFSMGFNENIEPFLDNNRFELMEGDIRNPETCMEACQGIDAVSHQAALGSVPRSIKDPLNTNANNIDGTLNVFWAAKEAGIKRVIYASSSSVYGDSPILPKAETNVGKLLSPYAVSKLVAEQYANVFGALYDMEFIGLRYFNVFGPNQTPNGPYAAVIPLFAISILTNTPPAINGDGSTSRDFTFVANAVEANICGLFTQNAEAYNQAYNVAYGDRTTLVQLFDAMATIANSNLKPVFGPERAGDIKHSLADISKATQLLGYKPAVDYKTGLAITMEWYAKQAK